MKDLQGKNIVLFAPKTFGYEFEIKKALELKGANVYLYDERPSSNSLIKIIIRFKKSILKYYTERYFMNIFKKHLEQDIDYFFIIKGEVFTKKILSYIKNNFKKSELILYLWDSLQNYNLATILDLFDRAYTFDKIDALKYPKLSFRPLFFIPDYEFQQTDNYLHDVLFIGTVHSDRYKFTKIIEKKLQEMNLNVYFFFFFQSKLLYLKKKLTDKSFSETSINDFHFVALTKQETLAKIKQTRIILDIQHPNQTGLTMRTIEAVGAKRKIITTNKEIKNYDFYNENNILVIDRTIPELDETFLKTDFISVEPNIYTYYKIETWVEELFLLK